VPSSPAVRLNSLTFIVAELIAERAPTLKSAGISAWVACKTLKDQTAVRARFEMEARYGAKGRSA
jgi:hypothetical protein